MGTVTYLPVDPAGLVVNGELRERPDHAPDLQREAEAFRELSGLCVHDPSAAVQRFLEIAVELCGAGSAGLSMLAERDGAQVFTWDVLAGVYAPHVGGTTPRNFSPCGLCLDRGATIVVARPARVFDYFKAVQPAITEALVVPLYDNNREPLGTLWIVHHDEARRFCANDVRIMEQLAPQLVLALKLARASAQQRRDTATSRSELLATQDAHLFLQSVLDASPDCINVLDLDGRLELMNAGGERSLEVDDASAVVGRPWSDLWEGEDAPKAVAAVAAARHGRATRFSGFCPTMKGTPRWWDVQVTPIGDQAGRPVKLLAMAHDITELRLAAQTERTLLDELEHRVKNMLAVVSAIVASSLRHAGASAELATTIQGRLIALSLANDVLTSRSWASASIASVVHRALLVCDGERDRISAAGPDIELPEKQAMALTLALHELCTNSVKYGALAAETGRVRVSWSVHDRDGQRRLSLSWTEQGGPRVKPPGARGFGSRLIEEAVAQPFHGTAQLRFPPSGVCWTLDAPLASPPHRGKTSRA